MDRFKYWYQNTFLMYYKWPAIGALFLFVCVIAYIITMATRVFPDLDVVVAVNAQVYNGQYDEIKALAEDNLPDLNGDGRVVVDFDVMSLLAGTEEAAYNMPKLVMLFASDDNQLFILDRDNLIVVLEEGEGKLLVPVAELGLTSNCEFPHAVRVDETPLFGRTPTAAAYRSWGIELYAVFRESENRSDPELAAKYAAAAQLVRLILETP